MTQISNSTFPRVAVIKAHGRHYLNTEGDERLIDLLSRHSIPWSGVSIYVMPKSGAEPKLASCLELMLSEFQDVSEIMLYYNRNVDPDMFSLDHLEIIDSDTPSANATEYIYQFLNNEKSEAQPYLKKLTPDECKSIIAEQVAETVRENMPENGKLVVGVSGGGDSNALLYSLSQMRDSGLTIYPIIIKGIPEWDKGVPRAKEICDTYGLQLKVMEEEEVKDLLGIPHNTKPLFTLFMNEFKDDDFEFFGTLLVRLALVKHAKDMGTTYICTGLNLEDVLCEGLFRLSSGLKPASIPARKIGDMTLLFPLWLCPKRILDGCFPKYSLENYEARYPCVSLGRNLYYSVVYSMQSKFPGFIEKMTRGISATSLKDPVVYTLDKQLGFHVERAIPDELRFRFMRMLGKESLLQPDEVETK